MIESLLDWLIETAIPWALIAGLALLCLLPVAMLLIGIISSSAHQTR